MRRVGKKDEQGPRPKRRSRRRVLIVLLLLATVGAAIFAGRLTRVESTLESSVNSQELIVRKEQHGDAENQLAGSLDSKAQSELVVTGSSGHPGERPIFSVEEFTRGAVSTDVVERNKWLEEFKRRIVVADSQGQDLHELSEFLRTIDAESDAFAPLIAAAGAVGTPAVQKILSQLIVERPSDWRTFSAVVPVLGGISAPTDQTIDVLARLAREGDGDFSSTAALALGATVHTLSKTQPQRGERILQSFISRLENPAEDVESLKEALAVVGNAGLVSTSSVLLRLTRHVRPDIRADAVMSLRFIRNSNVEGRFLELLETDPDLDVRLRVVDAWVHAPITAEVVPVVQRLVEASRKNPLLLREKSIDLLMHLELSDAAKYRVRDWLVARAAREDEQRMRSKLLSAATALATP